MSAVQVGSVYRVTDDAVYGFFKEHRDLSNFGDFKIEWEGLVYPSTEAAFQASKVLEQERRIPFTKMSPSKAKLEGRKLKNIRADWDEVKVGIMHAINLIKYTQHEDAKVLLLSTGDKYLEETNWWKDDFWGVFAGKGENWLGKILMKIRHEIK